MASNPLLYTEDCIKEANEENWTLFARSFRKLLRKGHGVDYAISKSRQAMTALVFTKDDAEIGNAMHLSSKQRAKLAPVELDPQRLHRLVQSVLGPPKDPVGANAIMCSRLSARGKKVTNVDDLQKTIPRGLTLPNVLDVAKSLSTFYDQVGFSTVVALGGPCDNFTTVTARVVPPWQRPCLSQAESSRSRGAKSTALQIPCAAVDTFHEAAPALRDMAFHLLDAGLAVDAKRAIQTYAGHEGQQGKENALKFQAFGVKEGRAVGGIAHSSLQASGRARTILKP